jgi:hypothetical protein
MLCPKCGYGEVDKLICSGCGEKINGKPSAEWNLPDANPPMIKRGMLCDKCNKTFGIELMENAIID